MAASLVVGADVGGTSVKYLVLDRAGHLLLQDDIRTDPDDPADTIGRLAAAVRPQLPGDGELAGVGLACAGIVSPGSGQLGRSPNLPGWQDSNLQAVLSAAFGDVTCAVANDVNAALYGEFLHGAGRGCAHLVMMALGTGVGGGVMVGGELLTGFADGAGEIGHVTLDLDGRVCTCGNRGCLEAYCGSVGLVRRARELADDPRSTPRWRALIADRGEALSTRDCHELAAGGDRTGQTLFAEAGTRLGQAAAGLVNALAPERVIIGGGVSQAGELLLAPCREMVARHVMSPAGQRTPVVLAELGTHAAAMGAAALAVPGEASP